MIVYLYFNTFVHFKAFVLSCSCIICAQIFDHGRFYLRSNAQMSNNDKLKLKIMQISTLKSLVYCLVLYSSMPAGLFVVEILQAHIYSGLPGKNITALSGKRCCIVLTLVSSASVDRCTVVGPFQAFSRIQQACCVY